MQSSIKQYHLLRGMVSYAILWPASSLTQEYLEYGTKLKDADWTKAARFGVFGSMFMTPFYHLWLMVSNRFFKVRSLKAAIKRALIEQVTYGPVALSFFFFGMSALELRPLSGCIQEVRDKFPATYISGMLYWPIVQTLFYHFIANKNRIAFLSLTSFVWTVYLAHMKDKDS